MQKKNFAITNPVYNSPLLLIVSVTEVNLFIIMQQIDLPYYSEHSLMNFAPGPKRVHYNEDILHFILKQMVVGMDTQPLSSL